MSTLATALVVTGGVMMVLQAIRGYCVSYSSMRQTTRIKYFYFQALMRQEVAWHDRHPPGELTSRMDGDIKVIERALGDNVMAGLQHIGTIGFGFGVAFYNGWELTLFMLGAMPFIACVSALMGRVMLKATSKTREGYAKAGAIALEAIDNIKTVQVFGREEFETDRFATAVAPTVSAGIRKEFATYVTTGVNDFVLYTIYGLGFWFGAYLIRWGRNSVSEVITIFFSALTASYAIGRLSPCLSTFLEGAGAAGKIFAVIDRLPPMDSITKPEGAVTDPTHEPIKIAGGEPVMDGPKPIGLSLPKDKFQQSITFKDVAFSYPTRQEDKLFTKLNLTITKGQTVAFSGASGSGKSSIVGLVQRFYDPTAGSVLVDGIDMKDLNLRGWRDCISIVSQEPKLFTGTVAENVMIGKPDATMEDVIAACTKAHVNHVIEALPQKYDTLVGTGGSQLSGGQKQRVAIARALLRKPQILILDEATSALDRKSEVEVQAALEDVMFGSRNSKDDTNDDPLTVIVIAHRLATIRNADVIHFINHDGEQGSWIEESGSYDELIKNDGHFATMTRKQTRGDGDELARQVSEGHVDAESVFAAEKKKQAAKLKKEQLAQQTQSSESDVQLGVVISPDIAAKDGIILKEIDSEDDGGESDGHLYTQTKKKSLKEIDEEAVKATPVPYLRVLGLCKGDRWAIALACFGCLGAGLVNPAYAIVFAYILEVFAEFETDKSIIDNKVPLWCSMFFVVAVVALICNFLLAFFAVAGENLTLKIRRALFYSMLRQDMTFFDTPGRDSSALATILSTDAEVIHGLWGPSAGSKVQLLTTLIAGLVIAFYYSWRCALVVIAISPIFIIVMVVCTMLLKAFGAEDDLGLKAEALTNIRTVISFNLQDTMVGKYAVHILKLEAKQQYNAIIQGLNGALTGFLIYGLMAMVSWYSGKLITDGDNNFLEVMVAQQAVMMGVRGLAEAGQVSAKFKDAGAAAQRVFYIIDREPKIAAIPKVDLQVDFNDQGKMVAGTGSAPQQDEMTNVAIDGAKNKYADLASIELSDLRFRYPARLEAPLLRGVSMDLEMPKTYGLMGETGCGKSTLIGLLARFYDPAGGSLTVKTSDASIPLTEATLSQWRSNISLVLQEPSLFSGSIRDNILYGRPDASEEEVLQAAKYAAIHDDIILMPNAYETDVGYKGQALSGGQKQRVAIARALIRKPRLLLMDEATSALDNATEGRVEQGLKAACKDNQMIVVSVAHRLTTIRDSDCIAVMEAGKLKEKGSHEELVALGGHYKERWDLFETAVERQKTVEAYF
eukprot:GILI01003119.1.p1 GENE.GILI01003119.1~~GILI01003119.1.p1  ORF type:complete len:1385 (+),score=394.98 GILI01003119.1:271-4155(+)